MSLQEGTTRRVQTSFVELFNEALPLTLESGETLNHVKVAYQTYGTLNADGTNAILICHALTGNAHAAGFLAGSEYDFHARPDCLNQYSVMSKDQPGWWDPLIGEGKVFDTNEYFVISSNILGSCYGTTGPTTVSFETTKKYGRSFPVITVRDMVRVQKKLVDHLDVRKLASVAGGSLGGMQVLEWALLYPELVESIIPIATAAKHSPWAIGLNQAARNSIKNDPAWNGGDYVKQPFEGFSLARKIAMISYRSYPSFNKKFGRERAEEEGYFKENNLFSIESYLNHQGDKLTKRFDANSYLTVSKAMDLHDVSRDRGSLEKSLGSIKCPSLNIGISSDALYPAEEQKEIASLIPNSEYAEIDSIHGHDAFLIEFEQLIKMIGDFLEKKSGRKKMIAV
ncbi:MAG: homoserine O-acetyltransferase [Bacteroidetes bacterium]|nr:homoserine O-acetyltransferase [Bacteroidota bacterium]